MNLQEMRKALEIFKSGQLIEVRSFGKPTMSGYFRDIDKLLECVKKIPNETLYFVMNEIEEACYSKEQRDKILVTPKSTTSDGDIVKRHWILVDADPKRVTGVSATDEEKAKAKAVIGKVYQYLNRLGFERPVMADSGNGYHLLYRVDMKNEKLDANTVKDFLAVLDMMFTDDSVGIDTSVFNASRITKLYGTVARKGANTAERPHRESKILYVPEEIKKTRFALIQRVTDMLPKSEKPVYNGKYSNDKFDIENFISKHGISVGKVSKWAGGTKYILQECIFNPAHTAPDAAIFVLDSGAISYHCFHNSCSGYTWQDVRMKFEPDSYDKKFVDHKPIPNYRNPEYKPVEVKMSVTNTGEPKFFTTREIRNMKRPAESFIKTGITRIDKLTRGLKKGEVTCISGLRASGKSSFLSQVSIEAVEQGYKVALYSGELTATNTNDWLTLQAAGKDYVHATQYENYFKVSNQCIEPITDWTNEKIYIYNNRYGNEVKILLESLNECVTKNKVDLVILDNLMALNLTSLDYDKFRQQSLFVEMLEVFAKENNVHIIFVAHPRKSIGFLRLDDVSGSGDITNRVDNAYIVHRVNEDFKRLSSLMYKWKPDSVLYKCNNVIEICKDRAGGTQDEFIPLYFEKSCKRLKNDEYENKSYGWKKPPAYLESGNGDILPFMK